MVYLTILMGKYQIKWQEVLVFDLVKNLFLGYLWKDLNGLRNKCAHHDLVWNNKFPQFSGTNQKTLKQLPETTDIKIDEDFYQYLYSRVVIIWLILKRIDPDSQWNTKLKQCINNGFPPNLANNITIKNMGFPKDWDKFDFWKLSNEHKNFIKPSRLLKCKLQNHKL